jgi:hypothetical protein
LTIEDSKIGCRFGYEFFGYVEGIDNKTFDIYTVENTLNIFRDTEENLKFSVCNSSMVRHSEEFTSIANFAKSSISHGDNDSTFGIAKSLNNSTGFGAIIALGDSGIIGKPMPKNPGPGLTAGDNNQLVTQIIQWLMKEAS